MKKIACSLMLVLGLFAAGGALADGGGHGGKAGAAEGGDPWSHHRGKVTWILGYEKGMQAVKDTGKPPMYFFTTTWCGYCTKLAQDSFMDAEIVKILEKFTPIIVDGDTEKEICSKYGVSGYPNVKFADAKGEAQFSVGGYVPKEKFLPIAQDAAKKIKNGKPSKEYQALLDGKADLDEAVAKGKTKAALAAITKIEKTGRTGEIPDAAKAAKEKLLAEGREKLVAAQKTAETDKEAARKAALALAQDFAGTPLAEEAQALAKQLAPPPEAK